MIMTSMLDTDSEVEVMELPANIDPCGVRFFNLEQFLEKGTLATWLVDKLQLGMPNGTCIHKSLENSLTLLFVHM